MRDENDGLLRDEDRGVYEEDRGLLRGEAWH